MGNAQSTSGDFCQNPGNAYPPTTGFTNPGFDAKATNQVTNAVNQQTRQTQDLFVRNPDQAAKVINTAHALLECDRHYREASAACDSAIKSSARIGAISGAVVAGSAKKSRQDIGLAAMATGMTGAINEWQKNEACQTRAEHDAKCRHRARNNPPVVYFQGRNKR